MLVIEFLEKCSFAQGGYTVHISTPLTLFCVVCSGTVMTRFEKTSFVNSRFIIDFTPNCDIYLDSTNLRSIRLPPWKWKKNSKQFERKNSSRYIIVIFYNSSRYIIVIFYNSSRYIIVIYHHRLIKCVCRCQNSYNVPTHKVNSVNLWTAIQKIKTTRSKHDTT